MTTHELPETNAPATAGDRGKRMLKKTLPALGLLLAAALPFSCAQNDPDAPNPGGYSTGLTITKVTAIPDTLPADGISESSLRLEARNRDGNPFPGRTVAFFLWDVETGNIGGIGEGVELRYCSAQSNIGYVRVATDITDADGVAWGVFHSGTGPVFGEVRDDVDPNDPPLDPCDCTDARAIFYSVTNFWTIIRGKLTDPRETESEYQIQDDVRIEHYEGVSTTCQ
jgi:hypothetical protein